MARGLLSRATHTLRYFLLRRLPTCKQMAVVMSESMERPLTLRERVLLRMHLWICVWCVWYLEHLRVLRDTLRTRGDAERTDDDAAEIHLSREARERIKRALESNS